MSQALVNMTYFSAGRAHLQLSSLGLLLPHLPRPLGCTVGQLKEGKHRKRQPGLCLVSLSCEL